MCLGNLLYLYFSFILLSVYRLWHTYSYGNFAKVFLTCTDSTYKTFINTCMPVSGVYLTKVLFAPNTVAIAEIPTIFKDLFFLYINRKYVY